MNLPLSKLLGTTILTSVIGLAGTAVAQQPPLQTPPAATVDEVVVTGTRLKSPEQSASNPVTTVTSETIELSGATNLGAFLTEVPALTNSLLLEDGADTSTPGLVGLNLLNLRNMGTTRSLVLIEGRRHVASNPGTSSVDINSIPTALIERVDVLTGGTSAVYGADGVSGAVNFILKKDFEGVDFRVQTGVSSEGDGENYFLSLLMGDNFDEGRGNVTFGLEWNKDDAIKFYDRPYTRPGQRVILVNNPDDDVTFGGTDDPNLPDLIPVTEARYYDTTRQGSIYSNFRTATTYAGVRYLADGTEFVDGISTGSFISIDGSGTRLDDFNDDLLPGFERTALNFTGRYTLSDRATVFGELKYTTNEANFFAQPSYVYGLFIDLDNPYIPAAARADALAPGGLGLSLGGVLLAKDMFDMGTQNYDLTRETLRGVIGVEGALTDNIDYEISYVYGEATQTQASHNVLIKDRFFAATDIVVGPNGPTCRSNLNPAAIPLGDLFDQFGFPDRAWGATFTPGAGSGCLPLNLFGEGVADPAAIDWVMGDYSSRATINQRVLTAFISGDTTGWFTLPGGPVSFVLGGEYREEESDSRPSDIENLAETLEFPISGLGRATRTRGGFDVKELFTEVSLPLLRDLPFAQNLTLSGAYRYSDYSSSGETETWNVNGRWQVTPDIAFRSAKATAVRAPNINNLFQGRQQTFEQLSDPCSRENLSLGENPTLRRQNCTADLTAMGVDPTTYSNSSSEAIAGFIRGNPDLQPEEADTFTLGVLLTPRFIPGLSIAADFYDITIDNAIQSYAAQTIVNNCYDLPRPNQFCDLIERGSSGGQNGRIVSFDQIPANIASYVTSGYDFTIRYRLDPADWGVQRDIGRFSFALVGNKLSELTFVEASGADPDNDVGESGAPEWQATFDLTWDYRDWTVNYGYAWFDETLRFSRTTVETQPDIAAPEYIHYDARKQHDIQVRYQVNDGFNLYGGVNNISDQQPEMSGYLYPVGPQGRFFYLGLKARLGSIGDALFWR